MSTEREAKGYNMRLPIPALIAFGVIIILATAIRIWSARGDMWIDEIWSLYNLGLATGSVDPVDGVALFFHANTHALNTVYMGLVNLVAGEHAPAIAYRALSIVSGVGAVWMAALIGRRDSVNGALITAFMTALSYPLVHYSGEARGYSTMMFAALASAYALDQYLINPSRERVRNFVIFAMIGLLSHLTFVVMLAGLGLWALSHIYIQHRSATATLKRLVPLFGIQSLTLLMFGALAVNNMVRGGDCCPEAALDSIQIITLLTFGINGLHGVPDLPFWGLYLFMMIAVVWLFRQNRLSWIMLIIVVVLFPLITVITEDQPNVIHRYFLLSALFGLMIYAGMLSHLWGQKGLRRAFAGMILVFFTLSNGVLYLQSTIGNRGQYRATIQDIVSGEDRLQRVTGYPDFSVGTLFRYYLAGLGLEHGATWVSEENEGSTPADWYIHGYLDGKAPADSLMRKGAVYTLHSLYSQWGLSGDTWALYWIEPDN
jgi:hypothetical protein